MSGVNRHERGKVVGWFRDKETAAFADFVERWPTLEVAQRARKDSCRARGMRHQPALRALAFKWIRC